MRLFFGLVVLGLFAITGGIVVVVWLVRGRPGPLIHELSAKYNFRNGVVFFLVLVALVAIVVYVNNPR